jgi:hypothetical protein
VTDPDETPGPPIFLNSSQDPKLFILVLVFHNHEYANADPNGSRQADQSGPNDAG